MENRKDAVGMLRMAFKLETTIPIVDYPASFGYEKRTVHIPPREFLKLAQKTSLDFEYIYMDLDKYIKINTYEPSIKQAMKGLRSKRKVVPAPYIEFKHGKAIEHEGRNRAVASLRLGIKTIPVHFIWKKGERAPSRELYKIKPYHS